MGADGAATLGAMGTRTVLQSAKKISTIKDKILLGSSGPVGLSQRFQGEIENLWEGGKFSNKKPHEAMTIIQNVFWKHVETEISHASLAQNIIGAPARINALCHTLVALPVSKKLCLFQFDQQCSPEQATGDLPFVSVGSGQQIADPFLAFLRRIFWEDKTPSVFGGIFATLWTLEHTILINPGGVADPKQIVIMRDNDRKIQELSKEELQEHYEAIEAAEGSLLSFRDIMSDSSEIKEITEIPIPKE